MKPNILAILAILGLGCLAAMGRVEADRYRGGYYIVAGDCFWHTSHPDPYRERREEIDRRFQADIREAERAYKVDLEEVNTWYYGNPDLIVRAKLWREHRLKMAERTRYKALRMLYGDPCEEEERALCRPHLTGYSSYQSWYVQIDFRANTYFRSWDLPRRYWNDDYYPDRYCGWYKPWKNPEPIFCRPTQEYYQYYQRRQAYNDGYQNGYSDGYRNSDSRQYYGGGYNEGGGYRRNIDSYQYNGPPQPRRQGYLAVPRQGTAAPPRILIPGGTITGPPRDPIRMRGSAYIRPVPDQAPLSRAPTRGMERSAPTPPAPTYRHQESAPAPRSDGGSSSSTTRRQVIRTR